MARPNTPWYRSSKDCWYVKLAGRTISLQVKGQHNRQVALVAFGKVLATRQAHQTKATRLTTGDLLDQFLSDARSRLKPQTITRYQYDTDSFRKQVGSIPARSLTHQHISKWLSTLPPNSTTRAIMLRSVSAALGWAVKEELLEANPARRVPKPKTSSRSEEALISEADHQKLLAEASHEFGLVLRVLYATGCRPGEVGQITVESFKPDQNCCVIHEHKTDRTGRPRLVFFPPELVAELRVLAERVQTGALLRSSKGVAWSARSILEGMRRLRKQVGGRAIAYGYRHTFVTAALESNLTSSLVAQLVGHTGTSVIERYYSHLGANTKVLVEALKKVRAGQGGSGGTSETK